MKITPLVATAAAVLTLGACSAAPVGLDSPAPAPSFDLSNTTLTATTTVLAPPPTCSMTSSPATSTTPTDTATTSATSSTTSSTTTTTTVQLSAVGTYAVAYVGPHVTTTCPTAP